MQVPITDNMIILRLMNLLSIEPLPLSSAYGSAEPLPFNKARWGTNLNEHCNLQHGV